MAPGSAASKNFLEMQILRPHHRPNESKTLRIGVIGRMLALLKDIHILTHGSSEYLTLYSKEIEAAGGIKIACHPDFTIKKLCWTIQVDPV